MISFVEWIRQWRFSNHEFNDLAYEINHRWTTFPSRKDLDNHYYLRTWLENNGASENMLATFDNAWRIYEQEREHSDQEGEGVKIKRVDISFSKNNDALPLERKNAKEMERPEHVVTISLSVAELQSLMSCLDMTSDYVHWKGFIKGERNSRYDFNLLDLESIRHKLDSASRG
jgi:uncharacterized protein YozE (UPF0346 family)